MEAMMIINDKLLKTGMSQTDVDYLIAQFLEEEAKPFLEATAYLNKGDRR